MTVKHVKQIAGHPLLRLVAAFWVEVIENDYCSLGIPVQWDDSAFFIEDSNGFPIAVIVYQWSEWNRTFYIGVSYTWYGYRGHGHNRALFAELEKLAATKAAQCGCPVQISSNIAPHNTSMQAAARAEGRVLKYHNYIKEVPVPKYDQARLWSVAA